MNLLQYMINKKNNNDDNEKLIIEFIKRNYNIFTIKFNYNISNVIFDILTQILPYQVKSEDEIIKIIKLMVNNFLK